MHTEYFEESELILIWGSNSIASNLHFWTRAQEAKRRGARLIAIDPYRSLTAEKCHQHIALKPGTDGALALGMMNVMIREGLIDHDYIDAYTLGFDQLKARADDLSAGACCGNMRDRRAGGDRSRAGFRIDEKSIDTPQLRHAARARRWQCGSRDRLSAFAHGRMARAVGGLAAVVVELGAGGCQRARTPRLVAGWPSKLPRMVNMNAIGDALLHPGDASFGPKVEALIVYNSNPVAVAPDSAKVAAGFRA